MSRLDDLLTSLCPEGVEYKSIGETCEVLTGGEPPEDAIKFKEPDGEYIYPIYSNGIGENSLWGYSKDYRVDRPAVTFSSIGTIGYPTLREPNFTPIIRLKVIYPKHNDKLDIRFLKYALEIVKFEKQKSSVPNINSHMIKKTFIPTPPVEIQREIVRILDSFTALTAELQAELQARKKQYEYYRDHLLQFDITPHVKLGDIAIVTKLAGFEFTKYVTYSDTGNIIALRGLNVKNGKLDLSDVKYVDKSDFSKLNRSKLHIGDMLFTYVGTIGQVALIDEENKYYLAPNVALIRVDNTKMNPYFMKYYFQSNQFWKTQINRLLQSSSMQNIPMEKIRKFELPLPSLDDQCRIVNLLNRFDTMCFDISFGLPAEIASRQKQYEYYRDKLLTFEEKVI